MEISDKWPGIPKRIEKNCSGLVQLRKNPWYGLGLYTVRRIVEAHGGFISFKDRPGGGTVFVIGLPGE